MIDPEKIVDSYRVANTITLLIRSLYNKGSYSELYSNLYNKNPLELRSMLDYFPFLPYSETDFSVFELLRLIILHYSKKGSGRVSLYDVHYSHTMNHRSQMPLLYLLRFGFIRLAAAGKDQSPNETYVQILDEEEFIQVYKNNLLDYLLTPRHGQLNDNSIVCVTSRILNYLADLSYIKRDVYKDELNHHIEKVVRYWTITTNHYMGANDAKVLFPFMTEEERRLLLLMQFKTKSLRKNKNQSHTFSLRSLDPEKQAIGKYRAILALQQMGFIQCVSKTNGERWYFDLDNEFKVVGTEDISTAIYPTLMSRYLCSIMSNREIEEY